MTYFFLLGTNSIIRINSFQVESEVDGGGSKMYIYEQRIDMRGEGERGEREIREIRKERG